jgi:sigma-B regulation protein RsbU (phosphoserine phosphatase)
MDVLIAEDELVTRRNLEVFLRRWGYGVVATEDGVAAWEVLRRNDAPRLAVLDWMMPGLDGPDVCRRVRQTPRPQLVYVILLTARDAKADVVAGLESGADDYIAKPYDVDELRARLRVGERMVTLQNSLADRVLELEKALLQVKHLQGLLPICAYCKRIRGDQDYWQQVEEYITDHSDARFSHGICPDCLNFTVKPELEEELRRLDAEQVHPPNA